MEEIRKELSTGRVDRPVFIAAVICCTLFYLPMVLFQETAEKVVPCLMNAVTYSLDWCFELVCFVCLIFCLWLIFGKYGKVRLGGAEAKSEFSNFTWVAMFFCAGIGAGVIYWACLEPMYYISGPPFGIEPFSTASREYALAYTCFHWSIIPWAIFAVPAIAFAYKHYNHGCAALRASNVCAGLFSRRSENIIGKIIDIFVIIGMLGGLATSLGFVFPMLSGIISRYIGIPDSVFLQLLVGLFFTLIFGYSCYRGIYSGIAKLSNVNMVMFVVMILFILLAGPTRWIISYFFESIGIMFQNFIRMSFYIGAPGNDGFAQTWTVFYWAWWLSWAIYIGLFMARISKGRTIRSFIANMLFTAGGGTAVICAIIGGYEQHVIYDLGVDLFSVMTESGGIAAIYTLLETLPLAKLFIPCFVLVLLVAQATGIDSAAYTLSNISCLEAGEGKEPPRWLRIFWALAIFFASVALILVGGMDAVKLSSVLTSVPLLALQVIFMVSVIRWLRKDIC
ncbi:MAG: BCCT family transporter [Clostridia bacterium]